MRAKQFFYVAASILMLIVAYSVEDGSAQGQAHANHVVEVTAGVNPVGGMVVAMSIVGGGSIAIRSDGTFWTIDGGHWQRRNAYEPLPIDVEALGHFEYPWIVSRDGDAWKFDGGNYSWIYAGRIPPPATIQVDGKSWSNVKDGYRK